LRAEGFDLERIIGRVGELFGMRPEEIKTAGKYQRGVAARSVVSYWAVRELGMSETEVARRLGVTQPAVSQAVKRGARIIEERHLKLKED
jgi:chromosomal replication initiation ATPase DnaA